MPKVLIADDSQFCQRLLSGWLSDQGFGVLIASDAIQAFVMATRHQPDAVVLDISMPGGSGIDVLKKLKLSIKTQRIPLLVITGNAGNEMRTLVKRLGAADLLEKPLDCAEFLSIMGRLTGQSVLLCPHPPDVGV